MSQEALSRAKVVAAKALVGAQSSGMFMFSPRRETEHTAAGRRGNTTPHADRQPPPTRPTPSFCALSHLPLTPPPSPSPCPPILRGHHGKSRLFPSASSCGTPLLLKPPPRCPCQWCCSLAYTYRYIYDSPLSSGKTPISGVPLTDTAPSFLSSHCHTLSVVALLEVPFPSTGSRRLFTPIVCRAYERLPARHAESQ